MFRSTFGLRVALGGTLAIAGAALLLVGLLGGLGLSRIVDPSLFVPLLLLGLTGYGAGIAVLRRPVPAVAAWLAVSVVVTVVVVLLGATVTYVLTSSV